MSEGSTETLVCAVCKRPCADKPHAKDAKGRVICRECLDKQMAARSATNTGGAGVMADLLSKSKMANATPCPNCKSYMPAGTIICTHCGYNTDTGKAANTRVIAAPKEKKVKEGGAGMSFNFEPMMGVWIMAAVYGALAIGCFAMPSLLMAFLAVAALHAIIVSIWVLVVMLMDGDIVWLLVSFIPIVGGFLMLYYLLTKLDRPAVKGHWILSVLATILAVALESSFGPEDAATARLPSETPSRVSFAIDRPAPPPAPAPSV